MSFCLRSWLTGFALGLSGKPYPYSKREPTAYLYNGVRLPALPEWDRGVYPYAVIQIVTSVNKKLAAVLNVYTAIEYGVVNETTRAWGIVANGKSMKSTAYFDVTSGIAGAWGEWVGETDAHMANSAIDWANFDVLNEDGTVWLAASEPVPVYE